MVSESKVIIDWLSVTSKTYSVADIMDLIGMSGFPWVQTKGAHGYRSRMYYDHISIHFDGNDSVWLEMSGQGCRVFESFGNGDYKRIFDLCADFGDDFHLTRLDIAYDDLVKPEYPGESCSGILDMKQLCSDTLAENFISKSTEWQVVQSSKGASIGVGSMKSDVYIRIYDKAAERGYTDGTHWIRVELQLRNSRALEFSKIDLPIGQAFCGVLLNYLRYLEPNEHDSNKSRWDIAQYWMNLIDDASAISIYVKPGTEYNMLRCENYVFNLAGNAVDALIQYYGTDKFVEKLGKRTTKPNPKYQSMLDSARRDNDFHDEKILDYYKSQLDDISPPQREKHYDVVDYDKNDISLQEYINKLQKER